MKSNALFTGTLFALAAGLAWGIVFVGPLLLSDYPAAMLAFGRYLAFGLIALPLAWVDRAHLARLHRSDWIEALKLALVGNILYYLFLASAIQRAGGPLPTVIIGTLPVVIALTTQWRAPRAGARVEARLPWSRLLPSLALIALGITLVNRDELQAWRAQPDADLGRYALGAALAVGAVACWTWYPIRNGEWLRAHPDRSPRGWATAQGLATLPLALAGFLGTWAWLALTESPLPLPLGPRPGLYLGLMLTMGLLASWLGTLCWNAASQRLPPGLAGQLIVFETLAALLYNYLHRGGLPGASTLVGVTMLVAGVLWALRQGRGAGTRTDSGRPEADQA